MRTELFPSSGASELWGLINVFGGAEFVVVCFAHGMLFRAMPHLSQP